MYPKIKVPCTLGADCCGIVEKVASPKNNHLIGKQVIINPSINWGPNQEASSLEFNVLGMPSTGTFSDYFVISSKYVYEKPKNLSTNEAAALPLAGVTAYRACFYYGKVDSKKRVLITGIGSGVAQLALVFCCAIGASTFVTSSNENYIERAKKLGAKGGVNYKNEDWSKQLLKIAGRFDVIIDGNGGDSFGQLIMMLNPGGSVVTYGATSGAPSSFPIQRLFLSNSKIFGTAMGSDMDFKNMIDFVEKYNIRIPLSHVYDFNQIVQSLKTMEEAQHFGKIVLTLDSQTSKL